MACSSTSGAFTSSTPGVPAVAGGAHARPGEQRVALVDEIERAPLAETLAQAAFAAAQRALALRGVAGRRPAVLVQHGVAQRRRRLAAQAGGEDLDVRTGAQERADHTLGVDRGALGAEHRHAGVSAHERDAHRAPPSSTTSAPAGDVVVDVEALLDQEPRARREPHAQVDVVEQSRRAPPPA